MTIPILEKFERMQPFTDDEAWTLFRLAAISEAVGWSLLILGILFKHFVTPGSNAPVAMAGQIHGLIFLSYLAAVFAVYSSLQWSRRRTIVAGLASIPPFGSLVFEQWAAYKRRGAALKNYRQIVVHALIIQNDALLVVQPKESGFWQCPGGRVEANETAEDALGRIVQAQTGITPSLGRLVYVRQYRRKSIEHMEFFFAVSNSAAYDERQLKAALKGSALIDDIRYLRPMNNPDLQPKFLQHWPVIADAQRRDGHVVFINKP